MFALGSFHRYHFYPKPCDMRKSFNGLSGLVSNELGREPTSGDVFIFLNRNRTHLKLLHWEAGGFVLYYKRLEQGSFTPPVFKGKDPCMTWSELVLMVEGLQVEKAHQKLRYPR
ncbi:MAG: IS66 family insertion sequence element accessory protein TnpB [Flavobacteriaceae bacterium]|nr:IS66 family insertion sequence element accessory protein TnpB [Flavobacteriaceae bacterium]